MNGLEFPVTTGQPCEGQGGFYYARTFINGSARMKAEPFGLGRTLDLDDIASLLSQVSSLVQLGPREKIAAIGVLRLCERRAHGGLQKLERVTSLGFVRRTHDFIPIRSHTLHSPNNDGVSTAICDLPGAGLLERIADMPASRAERLSHPAEHIVAAEFSEPGQNAYIAIRGIERLVSLTDGVYQ